MKNPVPLQFLVGLTRLIAIYFCIRGVDQLSGAILNYRMMKSMTMPEGMEMPSAWSIYLPAISVLFAIAIAVWFAAPLVCRIAIPENPSNEGKPSPETCWNGVMIFLVGVLFLGVGITRISDFLITIVNMDRQRMGCGVILMKRFPSIHRWIEKKMQA